MTPVPKEALKTEQKRGRHNTLLLREQYQEYCLQSLSWKLKRTQQNPRLTEFHKTLERGTKHTTGFTSLYISVLP